MDYIIVGTAGHVDHGKTVLVRALTNIDTDRLEEEKKRGISIKLGFAPLQLPSGRLLGLVDVPGHERFIKQMLAGIGGMDLVMLVVAVDEGVMPQTQEHLDIIDLLQIKKGLVVITKKDLVDEELLELVKEDIKDSLQGTILKDAPMVAVSAVNNDGMEEVINVLDKLASETPAKNVSGKVRLPIDRAFTISGFGTVITGTLWSGKLNVGDTIELHPGEREVRVRGLQVHEKKVDAAYAGQRVAVNLASIQVSDVPSGSVLLEKGYLKPSYRLDAMLKMVNTHDWVLKNRARVRIHHGTSELLARISLLEKDELKPGEETFVQLLMEKPLTAAKGDTFIVRSYSPMYTIGGGQIIEPHGKKLKRFREESIELLKTKLQGSPYELIEQYLISTDMIENIKEIAVSVGLSEKEAEENCQELVVNEKIEELLLDKVKYYGSKNTFKHYEDIISSELQKYHKKYPLRKGFPKEELRTRYFEEWNARNFNDLLTYLQKKNILEINKNLIAHPDFKVEFSKEDEKNIKNIVNEYEQTKYKTPNWEEVTDKYKISADISNEYKNYLINEEEIVKIAPDLFLHKKWLEKAKEKIGIFLDEHGEITISDARDLLESSRKYVLPILEYFDGIKFTKRVQDKRIKI
jgi:selenocysteine-specific elongation factor